MTKYISFLFLLILFGNSVFTAVIPSSYGSDGSEVIAERGDGTGNDLVFDDTWSSEDTSGSMDTRATDVADSSEEATLFHERQLLAPESLSASKRDDAASMDLPLSDTIDVRTIDIDDDGGELDNTIARDTKRMPSEPVTITRRIPPSVGKCMSDVRSMIDSCKRKVSNDVSACKQKQKDAIASCKKNVQKEIDGCKKKVQDRVNKCKEDVSREIDQCKNNVRQTIDRCKKDILRRPFCEAQRPILMAECERRRIKATKCEAEGRPEVSACEAKRPALMARCEANRINVPKCEFGRCKTPCCEAARLGEQLCQAHIPFTRIRAQVTSSQQNCMAKCKVS